jgi:hypothetical protein
LLLVGKRLLLDSRWREREREDVGAKFPWVRDLRGEICGEVPPFTAFEWKAHPKYFAQIGNQHHPNLSSSSVKMGRHKPKRKQQSLPIEAASKKPKTAAIVTPPPEKDAAQPKTIQSIGLEDDDLVIAIETLNTLTQNPSVIKSKACKDLRTAVYEFRQACTTGFNTHQC